MINRDQLFSVLKDVDPWGVALRKADMLRQRGSYIVPGPNYMWSIDGHLKLSQYGIEIYAAIDAYSRYIPWIYVGVSATTAVSVAKMYLTALDIMKVQPQYLRSDQGSETGLIMNTHWQLHQVRQPDIHLDDTIMFRTSLANIRIESCWAQLSKGQTQKWRVSIYFLLFYY